MMQESVERFVAAINVGDLDTAQSALLRDYFGYMPEVDEQTAPEAFRQVVEALRDAMPDLQVSLSDVSQVGDEWHGKLRLTGTFTRPLWSAPPDGKAYAL